MAEYRDVEPLRKQIVEFKTALKQFAKSSSFLMAYISGIDAVMEIIDEAPITDVQEVRHGRWECNYDRGAFYIVYVCSKCGRETLIKENFCPDCGARMDGKDGEE